MSLTELFEIRRRAAQAGSFQGYRSGPIALSGATGLAAGLLQAWWNPSDVGFVMLWIGAATIGFGYNLVCIAHQYGASPRRWERSLAFAALTDLSPAVLAGFILTAVFVSRGQTALLPGTWMVLFGSGVLASRRHLPSACSLVGGLYLLAGTITFALFPGEHALRAEVMAGVFGMGQIGLAVLLARSSE